MGSALAASHILRGDPGMKLYAAICDYTDAAGRFKNLQGEFRRARLAWSNKPFTEFERSKPVITHDAGEGTA